MKQTLRNIGLVAAIAAVGGTAFFGPKFGDKLVGYLMQTLQTEYNFNVGADSNGLYVNFNGERYRVQDRTAPGPRVAREIDVTGQYIEHSVAGTLDGMIIAAHREKNRGVVLDPERMRRLSILANALNMIPNIRGNFRNITPGEEKRFIYNPHGNSLDKIMAGPDYLIPYYDITQQPPTK